MDKKIVFPSLIHLSDTFFDKHGNITKQIVISPQHFCCWWVLKPDISISSLVKKLLLWKIIIFMMVVLFMTFLWLLFTAATYAYENSLPGDHMSFLDTSCSGIPNF